MKKIEAGIFKQDNGQYMVHMGVRVGGKVVPLRRRGISTCGEARLIKEDFLIRCAQGKERLRKGVVTLGHAIQEYLDYAEEHLRPSTWLNTKSNLEAHAKEFSDRYIDDFTTAELTTFIAGKFGEHSDDTKNNQAKYLRQVFKLQVDKGVLQTNPANGIRFKKHGLKRKKLVCMTKNEVVRLLEEAYRVDHPWKDIFFIMYQLGLRSGEGYELKFSDIDYENGFVNITRAFCFASKTIGPPKNRLPRSIPLNPSTARRLRELQIAAGGQEYVMPKHKMWSHGEAAKVLRNFQNELGIRQTNFHSLRASFITHLLLDGMPATKVMGMVGHADLKTTMQYVRLVASDLKGATDTIGVDLSSGVNLKVLPFKPRA